MRGVHKVTSESYFGLSKILVELDPAISAREIPQLWDELRRKVLNIQPRLPSGASPVTVADDFGDVYGIYYGLSVDEGFTWDELRQWAQRLKTALVTVDGVQKVTLFGEQTPVVNATFRRRPWPISTSAPKPSSPPSASRMPWSAAARSSPGPSKSGFWRRAPTRVSTTSPTSC